MEPWKRILFAVMGLFFLILGITAICAGPFWAGVLFAIIGVGILAFAWFGRKQTIDATLDSIDVVHLAAQFFDSF